MTNPFIAAYETSLSPLSEHDFTVLQNTYSMDVESCVRRVGKKWTAREAFGGKEAPLFRTKVDAIKFVSALLKAEYLWRMRKEYEAKAA